MSNCIELRDAMVVFPLEVLDQPKFKAFLDTVTDADRSMDESIPFERSIGYWFLKANTSIEPNCTVIEFGRGKSGHTWRDFKQTLRVLIPFIKRPIKHTFRVRDECDGFDAEERLVITFGEELP